MTIRIYDCTRYGIGIPLTGDGTLEFSHAPGGEIYGMTMYIRGVTVSAKKKI
jgi:hypothetical protein